MNRLFSFLFFILSVSTAAFSQEIDTDGDGDELEINYSGDSLLAVESEPFVNPFIPRKASLYSAVLPGLGQAYNKQYWKIPFIYGGFVGLTFMADYYNDHYKRFRKDLFAEIDDNTLTMNNSGFNEEQLRRLVDRTKRERDFYIILNGVLYFLQIAEAHIAAHLKEFKLNPDLQVNINPVIRYDQGINSGIALRLKF